MSLLLTRRTLPALFCAAALSGCGGGSPSAPLPQPINPPPATPAPPAAPPAPAALAVSTDSLALAVSGQSRQFVITNVGAQDALNLVASATTALPAGSGFGTDCATLAPGASCTLSVMPGAIPSAAPGDTTPLPAALSLVGSNTNTLALSVWVLDFGSVYQGGYAFDLDDGTPTTGGVGGKVMALSNAWPAFVRANDAPAPSSPVDGATNTANLVSAGGPPPDPSSSYAAWLCDASSDAGFTDWYLPAICEMGYDRDGRGSGCGSAGAPALPNIQSRLVDLGLSGGLNTAVEYWSSTGTRGATWVQETGASPATAQKEAPSGGQGLVRCVRALTP